MQINNTNLALLYRGFNVLFTQGLDATTPVCNPFVQEIPSSSKIEEYDWLNAVPGMKELKDEMETSNLTASQWTIANKEWYDLVAVKEWDIQDDKFGLYNPLMTNMGTAATMHKDDLCFNLLTNGFTSLCYTGKNFFDTGHIRAPGDLGFTNKMTAPLSVFAYQTARANLIGRKNSKGRPMNLGTKLALVVSPQLEPVARVIVENDSVIQAIENLAGTEIVAAATQPNINKGTASVIVSPYLSATEWFLVEIGKPIKPLVWQVNLKPVLIAQTSAAQSDHVFEKHEYRYQGYGRYNAGYLYPDLAIGSTGQGSAITQYP